MFMTVGAYIFTCVTALTVDVMGTDVFKTWAEPWLILDLAYLVLMHPMGKQPWKPKSKTWAKFHQAHARSQPQIFFFFCIVLIGKIQCTKTMSRQHEIRSSGWVIELAFQWTQVSIISTSFKKVTTHLYWVIILFIWI